MIVTYILRVVMYYYITHHLETKTYLCNVTSQSHIVNWKCLSHSQNSLQNCLFKYDIKMSTSASQTSFKLFKKWH